MSRHFRKGIYHEIKKALPLAVTGGRQEVKNEYFNCNHSNNLCHIGINNIDRKEEMKWQDIQNIEVKKLLLME